VGSSPALGNGLGTIGGVLVYRIYKVVCFLLRS